MATILVVDDSSENREKFAAALLARAHRVLQASSAAEALEMARKQCPHLITGKVLGPVEGGVTLAEALRGDADLRRTPILWSGQEGTLAALAVGRRASLMVIAVPISEPAQLVEVVEEILEAGPAASNGNLRERSLRGDFAAEGEYSMQVDSSNREAATTASPKLSKARRTLWRELIRTQEQERRHIGRELHDEIGQALTAVIVNLNLLQSGDQTGRSVATLQDTTAIARQTLERVRSLSCDLRPSMLDELGLTEAIRSYVRRQADRVGFEVHISVDSIPRGEIPAEVETACYRVVQEAVTNIVRHAQARDVELDLWNGDGQLHLVISDNGQGFDVPAARRRAARGNSLGLVGLEERVVLLGGQVEITSSTSSGTVIRATFPLDPHTETDLLDPHAVRVA